MFGVSAVTQMSPDEQHRVAMFQRRLATPVGELPEDPKPAAPDERVISPFRIVGICVLLIGLMLLGIHPWLGSEGLASWLNLAISALLLAIGGLVIWSSYRAARRR